MSTNKHIHIPIHLFTFIHKMIDKLSDKNVIKTTITLKEGLLFVPSYCHQIQLKDQTSTALLNFLVYSACNSL